MAPSAVLSSKYSEYFETAQCGHELIFFHSGPSKTLSAAACQYAISKWNLERLFCFGTAGGVSSDLKPLDLVIATKTVQYDCINRFDPTGSLFYEPLTTSLDNSWLDFPKLPVQLTEGLIATADQDLSFDAIQPLRENQVLVVDWESGAIAKICELNQIPCCIVRGVSDTLGGSSVEHLAVQRGDYRMNTPAIMETCLSDLLPTMLRRLQ